METDPHSGSIVAMRNQLQWQFEALPNVYVSGSMAVHYREGDRSAVVVPDVVVAGVRESVRRSYKTWEEGRVVPAFVVEVASPSTDRSGRVGRRHTYGQIGVREYWWIDREEDLIPQGLRGWRLSAQGYEKVRQKKSSGWYWSDVLGLELRAEG